MDRQKRLRFKLFISLLAVFFLFFLIALRVVFQLRDKIEGGQNRRQVHLPVLEVLHNVWVLEPRATDLLLFCNGEEVTYDYQDETIAKQCVQSLETMREQVADVQLSDGKVCAVTVKNQKIHGKILRADETGVWMEDRGKLPFAPDYKGYRIYQNLEMCTYADLPFGYDHADLVLEEGKVCALLLARTETMNQIRVLLRTSDYEGLYHDQVTFTADEAYTVTWGEGEAKKEEIHPAGACMTIDAQSDSFVWDRIVLSANTLTGKIQLQSIHRSQSEPAYRGKIELLKTPDGIVVINELPLEEYLYCVLPSEMPASYPMEALKAQAICARTYAYAHMQKAGFPEYGAHVDDSTAYQVYHNCAEQANTTTAVKETYGEILLTEEGNCAETFYYSTSCGSGSDAGVWKTERAAAISYLQGKEINQENMITNASGFEHSLARQDLSQEETFRRFITQKQETDFENEERWYRWTYQVDRVNVERMYEVLKQRYEANPQLILTYAAGAYQSCPIEPFSYIKDIVVEKRRTGGIADELILQTDQKQYKVISEYNIRMVLGDGSSPVICQDGKKVECPNLLPSAFFVLDVETEEETVKAYHLTGGGYGHGVGMSQNAAKDMANEGYRAEQILTFFYEQCAIGRMEKEMAGIQ